MRRIVLIITLCLVPFAGAGAVAVDESRLDDPAKEARARAIMKEIRCLVCQNQSIEDSNADLARDLRQIVRERVAAGASDDEVKAYLVARYGDWVLLNPPVNERTIVLWLAPAILVLIGAGLAFLYFRRRRSGGPQPLSAAERRRLDELLDEKDDRS